MNVVLIGYRGSGKTTIGKKLADRMWRSFFDLDDLVVAKAGKPIRDIFEQEGEPRFRELESQALLEVLQKPEAVIALGGGAVMREENRAALKSADCRIIYLACESETLHARIQADPATPLGRPSLTELGGGIDEIRKVLSERQPLYRQVMHAELEVTHLSPEDAMVYVTRML